MEHLWILSAPLGLRWCLPSPFTEVDNLNPCLSLWTSLSHGITLIYKENKKPEITLKKKKKSKTSNY
jgi:hypothetical protein